MKEEEKFDLEDFFKSIGESFKKEREQDIQRRKEWDDNADKPKVITPAERLAHQRSDVLLGLYPMNKEMLLKRIELINNACYLQDFYGTMYPVKPMCYVLAKEYLEDDPDKIYDYYLTEVKPHIF